MELAWGADAPDFGQLVKVYGATVPGPARYAPPKIVEAVPTVVYGTPDPALISTSYSEMAHKRLKRLIPPETRHKPDKGDTR